MLYYCDFLCLLLNLSWSTSSFLISQYFLKTFYTITLAWSMFFKTNRFEQVCDISTIQTYHKQRQSVCDFIDRMLFRKRAKKYESIIWLEIEIKQTTFELNHGEHSIFYDKLILPLNQIMSVYKTYRYNREVLTFGELSSANLKSFTLRMDYIFTENKFPKFLNNAAYNAWFLEQLLLRVQIFGFTVDWKDLRHHFSQAFIWFVLLQFKVGSPLLNLRIKNN